MAIGQPSVGLSRLAPALITDGGDVYWFDGTGFVFVERQNEARVVELKHSEETDSLGLRQMVLGMAAGADQLFVGDGLLIRGTDTRPLVAFQPPGRPLSISKQDGRTEVLLELRNRVIAPIAADSENESLGKPNRSAPVSAS
ncbi:MAG: hypothetical protein ABI895_28315 [Deltaproteobacteria bacterium]